MKPRLDTEKITKALGAKRRGKVAAPPGFFGALQLLADVQARFRTPASGGRPTDPDWTERRLVPLAHRTLKRLEEITATVRQHRGVNLGPMQLAGLLLERTTEHLNTDQANELFPPKTLPPVSDVSDHVAESRFPLVAQSGLLAELAGWRAKAAAVPRVFPNAA